MKKVFLVLAALCGMSAWAADSEPVAAVDVATVDVSDDYLEDEELEEVPQSPWSADFKGLYFGLGSGSFNGCGSLVKEVGVLQVVGAKYTFGDRNSFSLGAGYQYKTYALKKDYRFDTDVLSGATVIDMWEPNTAKTSSLLRLHTIQFPLTYAKGFGKKWHITVGGVLNWNFYASYNNSFKENNTTYSSTTNKLCQRKVSADVLVGVAYNKIALYARYSPCKLFKSGCGPEIDNVWTIGIGLGL